MNKPPNAYRVWRKKAGHNQTTLAAAIGVKPQTVQRWESGKADPSPRYYPALSKALGVSMDAIAKVGDEAPRKDERQYLLTKKEALLIDMLRDYGGLKTIDHLLAQMRKIQAVSTDPVKTPGKTPNVIRRVKS